MKKLFPLILCSISLFVLALLIARLTVASASPSLPTGGTPTITPTPTSCVVSYTYTTTQGALIPGDVLVSDPQCPTCAIPQTALPFPFTFYGQVYTALNILPQGNLQFLTASTLPNSCPAPYPELGPSIYPYWANNFGIAWGDPCRSVYGRPCGIYTRVDGTAPSRTYSVEWLALMIGSNHEVLNFQVKLHETTGLIDYVYGTGVLFGSGATIGLQDGASQFTNYMCNVSGNYQGLTIHWTPHFPSTCPTFTPIATATLGPTDTPPPPIFTSTNTAIPTTFVPTSTRTHTTIPTVTTTSTPTPEACVVSYTYTTSPGEIVTGDTLATNSNCPTCAIPQTALPFPFIFYGQVYTALNIMPQGNLQFLTTSTELNSCPGPYPELGPSIYPDWSWANEITNPEFCMGAYGRPCGIYTSVSGSEPNRTYNVEWLAHLTGSNHETVQFEARLHETTGQIDFVYGTGLMGVFPSAIGLQDGATQYSNFVCNPQTLIQNFAIHWTPHFPSGCPTFTPISTATPGPTDTPATPAHTATYAVPTHTSTPTVTRTHTGIFSPTSTSTRISTFTATNTAPATSTSTSTPEVTSTGTPLKITNTPIPTGTICIIQFSDVPEGSTFYPYIQCMACMGIINGYTTGCESGDPCFRPNNNITRGQLTKIVSNSAGFTDPATTQQFEDVPIDSTFYLYIWRLAARNIIRGYPCGSLSEPCIAPDNLPYFRPGNYITRGQLAKIDSEASGFAEPATTRQFEDVPTNSTFYPYIWRLTNRAIISGYPCGSPNEPCIAPDNLPYFRPQNNATRGQASKIVSNTFFPNCQP